MLEARELTAAYSGLVALVDVSIKVAAGEIVCVAGANGAGKSTLLRHAAGLLEPTRGRVSAQGRVALLLQNPVDYGVESLATLEVGE